MLEVDEAARKWIARKGYDPKMGARPMRRVVQENIKKELANELLFGELIHGGKAHVSELDGELSIDCTPISASRQKVKADV